MSEPETVNHPKHYFLTINGRAREAIDIVEELAGEGVDLGFHLGQAFIYIWRAHKKNGVNDLDKAWWYIEQWRSNVSLACAKPLVRAANAMARAVADLHEAMSVGVLVDVSDPPGQQRAAMSPSIAEGRTEEWIEEILRSVFASDIRPQPVSRPDGLDRILDNMADGRVDVGKALREYLPSTTWSNTSETHSIWLSTADAETVLRLCGAGIARRSAKTEPTFENKATTGRVSAAQPNTANGPGQASRPIIVQVSMIKEIIRAAGCRPDGDLPRVVSDQAHKLIDDAIAHAKNSGRSVVRPFDVTRQPLNFFVADVAAFHRAGEQLVNEGPPAFPNTDVLELRERLIREEFLDEYLGAVARGDLVGAADGLIDLLYVVIGTMVSFGLPVAELWAEVQRSNMAKFEGGLRRREDGKILKPEGWTPPNIAGVLEAAGWVPDAS